MIKILTESEKRSGNFQIAIGVSMWTSAGRKHAVHIQREVEVQSEHGDWTYKTWKNLCGKEYKHGNLDSYPLTRDNFHEVTCDKCLREYSKLSEALNPGDYPKSVKQVTGSRTCPGEKDI